eukprot:Nitzschia sp. Nitz4//scaffold10_size219509//26303//28553//NITZ4_001400-RA/size219509-processed-gene-0.114-mRNA-1//-1//CDS//3329532836//6089//frame0
MFQTFTLLLTVLFLFQQSFHPSATLASKMSTDQIADESSAILVDWSAKWSERKIGFHMNDVNPILTEFGDKLFPKEGDTCSNTRVFVPLCGKTVDMAYLTQVASEVVGVEGIRVALEEFAEEQPQLNVKPTGVHGAFERFEGDKISLLKGDFFVLDDTSTNGKFGAIYDRASIVAINPSLRQAYVDVIGRLIAPGGRVLLALLERVGTPEGIKMGPPFSFSDAEGRSLFESQDWVESMTLLKRSDEMADKPGYKERYPELDHLMENYCYDEKSSSSGNLLFLLNLELPSHNFQKNKPELREMSKYELQKQALEHAGVSAEESEMAAKLEPSIYERLGDEGIKTLTTMFYDRVFDDKEAMWFLNIFSSSGKDDAIDNQYRFLVQTFGGPDLYREKKGKYTRLVGRHSHYNIGHKAADHWVDHMEAAMSQHPILKDDDEVRVLLAKFFRYTAHYIVVSLGYMRDDQLSGGDKLDPGRVW